jgi:uncharacterized membrane protein HdeD (DUF308 family)
MGDALIGYVIIQLGCLQLTTGIRALRDKEAGGWFWLANSVLSFLSGLILILK